MKYILKYLYNINYRRIYKVKLNSLKYVYLMKYSDKQTQFIKKKKL